MKSYHVHKVPEAAQLPMSARPSNGNNFQPKGAEG